MVEICFRTDANVLLVGETGVGKDLIASVIHRNSHRRGFPFVKVACTLLPPQLIESELYGHEKGSFTGADQQRPGRFELAEGGTLYLDDVDDIPLEHQSKLLRAIEEKVFERVGGTRAIKADVRIIASTKSNLLEKIAEGAFRQDLYYRLDVLRINVPPLRERLEDVPTLAEHLLARIAKDRRFEIDPEAIEALMRHQWPGNVRELYHALERAYLIGSGRISAGLARAGAAAPGSLTRQPSPQRQLPGDDGPGRAATPGERPEGGRREQDRSGRGIGDEAVHFPRPAGEARARVVIDFDELTTSITVTISWPRLYRVFTSTAAPRRSAET